MPIHLRPKKSKKGINLKIKDYDDSFEYEIRELFVGKYTIFSLLGFSIGGILVGRSFWAYGDMYIGLPATILIGIVIFVASGISLSRFHK